jgi:hypothetical protein
VRSAGRRNVARITGTRTAAAAGHLLLLLLLEERLLELRLPRALARSVFGLLDLLPLLEAWARLDFPEEGDLDDEELRDAIACSFGGRTAVDSLMCGQLVNLGRPCTEPVGHAQCLRVGIALPVATHLLPMAPALAGRRRALTRLHRTLSSAAL